ncbi:MAG TPA: Mov34/MPN/PAD-1 family protein [Candidatus Polarisedimenticolaceae bacterium]|nr:Mov34/MPN/PAD-1 family protein [Candidatus Polarisedimenticolaceae bacterium]
MRVILQLRRRGGGRRESGAFLLGRQQGRITRVTTFVCYDDLDSVAYQAGAIAFHADGYAAFWKYCREKGLAVLADVHTHPGDGVGQSSIDQRNPMMPIVGHTAIIVPKFARTSSWSLSGVGIYEYLGDFKWRTHAPGDKTRRVVLTLW